MKKRSFIDNGKCFFYLIFLFVFFFCNSPSTVAQSAAEKGLPFLTNYSLKDYHAHPQNWAITQDDKGIMYFGNSICLLEYDGVHWKKLSFGGNTVIRSLAKDQQGQIYYGSHADFGYVAPDSLGQ